MSTALSVARDSLGQIFQLVDAYLSTVRPLKLVLYCCGGTYVVLWIKRLLDNPEGLGSRSKKALFAWLRRIPFVQNKIKQELEKLKPTVHEKVHHVDKERKFKKELPEKGLEKDQLIAEAKKYHDLESLQYFDGKVSGAVFSDEPPELRLVLKEVFDMFAWSNPLHPHVYPGCRKMEAEIVRMCCQLFHGGPDSCGTMSTGGTVSILLACLAYRNRALANGIDKPEMVMGVSAHAAFDKAGEVFGIGIRKVKLDKKTMQVDVNAMRKAINARTCMLVGSAPGFPHGVMDSIEEIAQLGLKRNVPVHVDACLGGWLLPFLDEQKYDVAPYDFRLPGVTSISSDSHKYGLTPKGSSVVLYRSKEFIHHQYFCATDWPGGIYASSTLEGSRSGANIAITWATLLFFGKEFYTQAAEKVVGTVKKLRHGLSQIPGLELIGQSDVCIVAFTSSVWDIFAAADKMGAKGWHLDILQHPAALHVMVTLNQTKPGVCEGFLEDLKTCVIEILEKPNEQKPGAAAMYSMAATIPDRSIVNDFTAIYLDSCYSTEGK